MALTVSNGSGGVATGLLATDAKSLEAAAEASTAAMVSSVTQARAQRVGYQALEPVSKQALEDEDEIMPPAPRLTNVQEAAVEEAFSAIVGAFGALKSVGGDVGTSAGKIESAANGVRLSLKDLGQATTSVNSFLGKLVPMIELQVNFFRMQQEFFVLSAGSCKEVMGKIRDHEAVGQKNQLTLEMEAAEENRKVEQKGRKASLIGVVLGFVFGSAQVVSGLIKISVGLPTGMLEIAGGLVSIGNASLKTVVFMHPQLEGKLGKHIERLDKAEIAMALVCAAAGAIDLRRMVKGGAEIVKNTKSIVDGTTSLSIKAAGTGGVFVQTGARVGGTAAAQVTGNIATEAAQKTLARGMIQAFRQSEKVGLEFCEQIGKRVAQDSAEEIGKAFSKRLLGVAGSGEKSFAKLYSKVFGEAGIQKLVAEVMEGVGKKMAKEFGNALAEESIKVLGKSAVKAGAKLSAEATEAVLERVAQKLLKDATRWLTFNISRQVGWNMTRELAYITASITMASTVVTIATRATGFVIKRQQNEMQARADHAMEQFMWLEFMKSVFALLIKGQKDGAQTRGDEFATHTQNAMDNVRTLGQSTQMGYFGGAGSTA